MKLKQAIMVIGAGILMLGCSGSQILSVADLPKQPHGDKGMVYVLTGFENTIGSYYLYEDCLEKHCIAGKVKGGQYLALPVVGKHTYYASNAVREDLNVSNSISLQVAPNSRHYLLISPSITTQDKFIAIGIFAFASRYMSSVALRELDEKEGLKVFEEMKNKPVFRVHDFEGEYYK